MTVSRRFRRECAELRGRIELAFGGPVDLHINDNTSSLISLRPRSPDQPPRLSVHHMFLVADDGVVRALAQFVRRRTTASQAVLRAFIDSHTGEVEPLSRPRVLRLRARGATYNLHDLARAVNGEFFGGVLNVYVTWSRGRLPAGRRRHVTFGSYDHRLRLIRIHPVLDRPEVPEFVVRFIVFHEMLHAVFEVDEGPGRRELHSREFRRREREHPDYDRFVLWQDEFMKSL
jgi:hypothetical protein